MHVRAKPRLISAQEIVLPDTSPTLAEVQGRIAVLEDNLRDLTEQAAAYSGAGDEDRSSARIADLERQLDTLKKQREQIA
jgi:hypothetical protein